MNVTIGATLTGGSTVALSPAGISPGKSVFVTPSHSRLEPETVEFTVSQTGSANAPQAKTGLKISFASRVDEEGCCTVKAGAVVVDLGVRWDLSQPDTLADDVIAMLKGLVYTTSFADAVKKGILPNA